MLPLIIAVTYAAWEMNTQARVQQRLVMDQAQISQLSTTIQDLSKEIERSARQYQLLRDQSILDILQIKQFQLAENLNSIAMLLPPLKTNERLEQLDAIGRDINTVSRGNDSVQQERLEGLYVALKESSFALQQQLRAAIQDKLNSADQELSHVLWRVLITGLLALPASLFLLGAGSIIATRSIRRLSLAINHLGERNWESTIEIDGPSDLIELGHKLEWMRLQLLSSERQKAQFTQHITHELKSPLAAIMDAQALLADQIPGAINNQQMAVLKILRSQAENLQELIQQLLNFNTVSQGVASHKETIDLNALCKKLIARYQSLLPNSAIKINHPNHPYLVTANAELIDMILSNLLSNAIHFCKRNGEVNINWGACFVNEHDERIASEGEATSHWWLQLSDDGPGIDADEQDAIFRPFYQGKNKRQGALKGSGIGLAIVKACVEQSKATLCLRSKKNEGAEFTLCFPKQ
tara:strand:+ start:493 stop:1896 length:1404 start_codon:yes stop_codon:yes gene_type:complete